MFYSCLSVICFPFTGMDTNRTYLGFHSLIGRCRNLEENVNKFASRRVKLSSNFNEKCSLVFPLLYYSVSYQWMNSIYLYLYIIFDQCRLDIIDQVELWSPRQVTHLPPVWDLLRPLA